MALLPLLAAFAAAQDDPPAPEEDPGTIAIPADGLNESVLL